MAGTGLAPEAPRRQSLLPFLIRGDRRWGIEFGKMQGLGCARPTALGGAPQGCTTRGNHLRVSQRGAKGGFRY